MKKDIVYNFDEYTMRLIKKSDFENYYANGFLNSCEETDYFTGTTKKFSKEEVEKYIDKIVDANRYDFIIIDKDGKIIGEVVLNEVEDDRCNFRIAIFTSRNFSKGIGFKASECVLEYAKHYTDIHIIGLEVYPFNERGIGLYEKIGFKYIRHERYNDAEEPYDVSLYMEMRI